jgi:hypothetical protein
MGMRKPVVVLSLLVTGTLTSADELVLKDGKTVVWTALRDLGDSYEVETPDGVKLEYRKSDVAKFVSKDRLRVQKEAATAPLTGATSTWDKSKKLVQMDLLRQIDPKRDGVRGTWKFSGGALVCDVSKANAMTAILETNYVPPEEYDLSLVVERLGGDTAFFAGIPGGASQVAWGMDTEGGWQGPWLVDGMNPGASKLGIKERVFEKAGQKRTLLFQVRRFGFAVKLDGKDYFVWKGEWSRVKPCEPWNATNTKSVYFGWVVSSAFKISQGVISFPKE